MHINNFHQHTKIFFSHDSLKGQQLRTKNLDELTEQSLLKVLLDACYGVSGSITLSSSADKVCLILTELLMLKHYIFRRKLTYFVHVLCQFFIQNGCEALKLLSIMESVNIYSLMTTEQNLSTNGSSRMRWASGSCCSINGQRDLQGGTLGQRWRKDAWTKELLKSCPWTKYYFPYGRILMAW